jgi:hypothetical protein
VSCAVQFARNPPVYEPGAIPVPSYSVDGQQASLLEHLLRETEHLHARIRRYTSPDEHPFFPDGLPPLILPPLKFPEVCHSMQCRTPPSLPSQHPRKRAFDIGCEPIPYPTQVTPPASVDASVQVMQLFGGFQIDMAFWNPSSSLCSLCRVAEQ